LRTIDETKVRNARLEATGWFSQFWGPTGCFPCQLVGQLTTGEMVYFHARGKNIRLEIAASEADYDADRLVASFYQEAVVDDAHEFGASLMDEDAAAELIERWLGEFRSGARPMDSAN
jgi:hypothetical protein